MLCVAACLVPKPERDRYDSEALFRSAERTVRECWLQPRIEIVQSILLLSLHQTGCGDKQSAFGFAAQACTMALGLGLNNAIPRTEDAEEVSCQLEVEKMSRSLQGSHSGPLPNLVELLLDG